jgi:hypothetical protein
MTSLHAPSGNDLDGHGGGYIQLMILSQSGAVHTRRPKPACLAS